jgi:hypothetical protein
MFVCLFMNSDNNIMPIFVGLSDSVYCVLQVRLNSPSMLVHGHVPAQQVRNPDFQVGIGVCQKRGKAK